MSDVISISKLPKYYWDKGDALFQKGSVTIHPGVTILVGCNGSGKTTFLEALEKKYQEDKNTYLLRYFNRQDGHIRSMSGYLETGNIDMLADVFGASEGEEILSNFGYQIMRAAGNYVQRRLQGDPKFQQERFMLLLDGCDSGASLDMIKELRDGFSFLLENIHQVFPDFPIYIIASANNYAMTEGAECLEPRTMRFVRFQSYEEYKEFIFHSRDMKERRLERYAEYRKTKKENSGK